MTKTYHITLGQYGPRCRILNGGGYSPRVLESIRDIEVEASSQSAARQLSIREASELDPALARISPWKVLQIQEVAK
jgi:hypothetical protein